MEESTKSPKKKKGAEACMLEHVRKWPRGVLRETPVEPSHEESSEKPGVKTRRKRHQEVPRGAWMYPRGRSGSSFRSPRAARSRRPALGFAGPVARKGLRPWGPGGPLSLSLFNPYLGQGTTKEARMPAREGGFPSLPRSRLRAICLARKSRGHRWIRLSHSLD